MDESSRNIIKFIAALTGAILLLMAAWFIAKSQETKPQPIAEKTEKPEKSNKEKAQVEEDEAVDENVLEAEEGNIVEEDIPLITGEPTIPPEQDESSDLHPPE